jgi:hypothetical protein
MQAIVSKEEPKPKTRLSASLKPAVAAAYAEISRRAPLGDSELISQAIIRLYRDIQRDGKLFVQGLEDAPPT